MSLTKSTLRDAGGGSFATSTSAPRPPAKPARMAPISVSSNGAKALQPEIVGRRRTTCLRCPTAEFLGEFGSACTMVTDNAAGRAQRPRTILAAHRDLQNFGRETDALRVCFTHSCSTGGDDTDRLF